MHEVRIKFGSNETLPAELLCVYSTTVAEARIGAAAMRTLVLAPT